MYGTATLFCSIFIFATLPQPIRYGARSMDEPMDAIGQVEPAMSPAQHIVCLCYKFYDIEPTYFTESSSFIPATHNVVLTDTDYTAR